MPEKHIINFLTIKSLFYLQKDEFALFWDEHRLNPLTGRNRILASLCPQVYGLYVVKLAVAMVLAGGVRVGQHGAEAKNHCYLIRVC